MPYRCLIAAGLTWQVIKGIGLPYIYGTIKDVCAYLISMEFSDTTFTSSSKALSAQGLKRRLLIVLSLLCRIMWWELHPAGQRHSRQLMEHGCGHEKNHGLAEETSCYLPSLCQQLCSCPDPKKRENGKQRFRPHLGGSELQRNRSAEKRRLKTPHLLGRYRARR